MTETLFPGNPYDSLFEQMSNSDQYNWQNQYYNHIPTTSGQWAGVQEPRMGGMQDVDLSIFQYENSMYAPSYSRGSGGVFSPGATYGRDGSWNSDMDTSTPSPAGISSDFQNSFRTTQTPMSSHLRAPKTSHGEISPAYSPRTSYSGVNSVQASPQLTDMQRFDERPGFNRSISASEQRSRGRNKPQAPANIKRSGSSDEDEDEFSPGQDTKTGGRKRQRIPHTAVERRYRENLNAHLDKLRQTVPTLAKRGISGSSKDGGGEGVKPSKCEILSGAIDHIGALDRENAALKNEVHTLRMRVGNMDKWYGGR